jgi:hypothetical protein
MKPLFPSMGRTWEVQCGDGAWYFFWRFGVMRMMATHDLDGNPIPWTVAVDAACEFMDWFIGGGWGWADTDDENPGTVMDECTRRARAA